MNGSEQTEVQKEREKWERNGKQTDYK